MSVFSPRNKKELERVARILSVVAKFELGNFTNRIPVKDKSYARLSQKEKEEILKKSRPERVRLMLEELGTTFVKFGQILGTRADIVGEDYASELSRLQDGMKPFPAEQAKRIIKDELGKPVDELFSSFDDRPMASASIAQVHLATLKSGKRVAVKVQRPGIEDTINEDIRIMYYLAHMAQERIPESRKYDPVYLVSEFERSILKELDFLREARNAEHLREDFKKDRWVYIPKIYDNLSTKRVLVMEMVEGTRLSEVAKSHSKKFDKEAIAHRLAQTFFKMVLVDGFYHADPHPGNIIIVKNGIICFLDYGRVNTISSEVAENIFRLALFAVNDDPEGLVAHLIRTDMISDTRDMDRLKADMTDLLDKYYSTQIKDVNIADLLTDLITTISKYNFKRPRELAELTRTLLVLEGTCMQLYSNFSVAEEFEPYAKKVLPASFSPAKLASSISSSLVDLQYLARTMPSSLRRFMKRLEDGTIRIEMEHKDLAFFSTSLERMANRMSLSLLLAAMIVGSALIVSANRDLGIIGFVVSGVLAMALVVKMFILNHVEL